MRLRASWPLQFADHELRQILQERKAAIVEIARLYIQDGERTDAAAVAEDERMTGIEANAGSAGDVGVVGKSLVQVGIADDEGLALEYGVTTKGIVTRDLAKFHPEA